MLGVVDGQLKPCPNKPNCVNSQAEDAQHKIDSIKLNSSLPEAKSAIHTAVEGLGGRVVEEESNYIKALFSSKIFGFKDDIEFYFSNQADHTRVDVRSASRVGYSDLGVNRERVEAIRQLANPID
jgi:uncharacterized protein (DUF1499 family)